MMCNEFEEVPGRIMQIISERTSEEISIVILSDRSRNDFLRYINTRNSYGNSFTVNKATLLVVDTLDDVPANYDLLLTDMTDIYMRTVWNPEADVICVEPYEDKSMTMEEKAHAADKLEPVAQFLEDWQKIPMEDTVVYVPDVSPEDKFDVDSVDVSVLSHSVDSLMPLGMDEGVAARE